MPTDVTSPTGEERSELLKASGRLFEFNRLIANMLLSQGQDADDLIQAALSGNYRHRIESIARILAGTGEIVKIDEVNLLTTRTYRGQILGVTLESGRYIALNDPVIARAIDGIPFGKLGWIIRISIVEPEDTEAEPRFSVVFGDEYTRDHSPKILVTDEQVEFGPFRIRQSVRPKKVPLTSPGQMFPELIEDRKYTISDITALKGIWMISLEGISGIFEASNFNEA